MNKVFKVTRIGNTSWDKARDLIIVAPSEMEARLVLAEEAGSEGRPSEFTFEEVDLSTSGIICKHILYS